MAIGRVDFSSLIAVPVVVSLIPFWPYSFVEIDCEIFSTVILLLSTDSSKGCCLFIEAKVLVYHLS